MLTPLAVLLGCPWISDADQAARLDPDGDGVLWPDDCADDDADVFPGAKEICDDGIDNDCDEVVDACDADGDGSVLPADCDDDDAAVFPGAEEICDDAKDNDCDEVIDACDADGDGVVWPTDCDDDDAAVYPDAAEVCNDGRDNDCDGVNDGCRLAGQAQFEAGSGWGRAVEADATGVALAAMDATGDGVTDLVAATPMALDDASSQAGGVRVWAGPLGTDVGAAAAWAEVTSPYAGGEAGWVLANGDFDDDGDQELAMGAPWMWDVYETGAVVLVNLPLAAGPQVATPGLVGRAGVDERLGGGLAAVRTAEGVDALAVAVGELGGSGTGGLCLFAPAAAGDDPDDARWCASLGPNGGFTGGYLATLPDTDGDGLDELAVGNPGISDVAYSAGAVWVVEPADGAASAHIAWTEDSAYAGWSVAGPGDVDGDGYGDLIVGAPGEAGWTGAARLFTGPLGAELTSADATAVILPTAGEVYVGFTVQGTGDMDEDGHAEVAVAAPLDVDYLGRVGLFYGPVTGTVALSDAAFTVLGTTSGDTVGWSILGPADLDDDGFGDLAIGGPALYSTGLGAIAWFQGVTQ